MIDSLCKQSAAVHKKDFKKISKKILLDKMRTSTLQFLFGLEAVFENIASNDYMANNEMSK